MTGPLPRHPFELSRRRFLHGSSVGIGGLALGAMLGRDGLAAQDPATALPTPKARRVIYLFQSGAPSHVDLFDPKPALREHHGEELPPEVRGEQRLTGMSAYQARFPLAGSPFEFAQHGQSGAWLSEVLPHTARIADRLCIVRSVFTEAINHDPAATFMQTGSEQAGRPSFGSWISYGLGSECDDLPGFVVLVSAGQGGQPLYARLWGNGFLDTRHQGVPLRSGKDKVLYLADPDGTTRARRRRGLDALSALDRHASAAELDPAIEQRIAQYELGYAMQTSVPEVSDLSAEPDATFERYGRTRASPARSPPTASSRDGWWSAACASCSSITRDGTTTATCPAGSALRPRRPIRRARRWSRTSPRAGCSKTRW